MTYFANARVKKEQVRMGWTERVRPHPAGALTPIEPQPRTVQIVDAEVLWLLNAVCQIDLYVSGNDVHRFSAWMQESDTKILAFDHALELAIGLDIVGDTKTEAVVSMEVEKRAIIPVAKVKNIWERFEYKVVEHQAYVGTDEELTLTLSEPYDGKNQVAQHLSFPVAIGKEIIWTSRFNSPHEECLQKAKEAFPMCFGLDPEWVYPRDRDEIRPLFYKKPGWEG